MLRAFAPVVTARGMSIPPTMWAWANFQGTLGLAPPDGSFGVTNGV